MQIILYRKHNLCQHCVTRTPYALRARSLSKLLVLGYAGATLCATVLHVLRTNRLGVDIPFTHSPTDLAPRTRIMQVASPSRARLAIQGRLRHTTRTHVLRLFIN